MKVLIIARGIPSDKYPMQGLFEFDQAIALSKQKKWDIIYLSFDLRSIRRWRKWGITSTKKSNIKMYCVNIPMGQLPKKVFDLVAIRCLKIVYKIIKKENGVPDIIHAHFIEYGYYMVKAFEKENIPLFMTEHSSVMNTPIIEKYFYNLGKYTYSKLDQLICVSSSLANKIEKTYGVSSIVIPNIVDFSEFSYTRKEIVNSHKINIVSVGNLIKSKNFNLLIKAFADAFKDQPVTLIIIGDGPEKKALINLAQQKQISNQVKFLGKIKRDSIAAHMEISDFFVLASDSETFGLSYIEAMAKGLPVIATKCGGPEDFVNRSNGILIKCNNLKALTTALINMKNNISKYNSKEISENIYKHYSANIISEKIIKEYEDLLTKKGSYEEK